MTTIGEVMSKELVQVEASTLVADAATVMIARSVGSALVMRGNQVGGIFTERDIMIALSRHPDLGRTSTVREWMTPDPVTIDAGATVEDGLDKMLAGEFRHLPVVDDDRVIGVVSMRDLSRAIAKPPSR